MENAEQNRQLLSYFELVKLDDTCNTSDILQRHNLEEAVANDGIICRQLIKIL